jgi:putative glutathione S-transferase
MDVTTKAGKSRTALHETGDGGAFVRKDSVYRSWIEEGGEFPPEAGRYTLYICYACPWANRCLAVRNLKGLQDAIDLSVTHPTWQRTRPDDPEDEHTGWTFADPSDPPFKSTTGHGSFPCDDCIPDPNVGAKYIRDLYEKAGDTNGKYTVPVLWDKKRNTIVNNESADIVRMLNERMNKIAKNPDLDLYPEELRSTIDEINSWTYPNINNGVYRCGFAQGQQAYEGAFKELFDSLDKVESILSKSRFLAGNQLTEADVRLFMTLIRFDEVYVVYFKTNRNFIREMPNTMNYVRELYQMPGIKEATNINHIKTHYFTSHPRLNYFSIIPTGPGAWWEEPHDRDEKFPNK